MATAKPGWLLFAFKVSAKRDQLPLRKSFPKRLRALDEESYKRAINRYQYRGTFRDWETLLYRIGMGRVRK